MIQIIQEEEEEEEEEELSYTSNRRRKHYLVYNIGIYKRTDRHVILNTIENICKYAHNKREYIGPCELAF